jgi:hypothetical protein
MNEKLSFDSRVVRNRNFLAGANSLAAGQP